MNSSIAEEKIIKEKPFSLLQGLHKIESGKVYEAVSQKKALYCSSEG